MSRSRPPRLEPLVWLFALAISVLPLWLARELPLVDLPQHSYVLAVLPHLDDPATLYPRFFEPRPGLRPYLGYYAAAGFLARFMPIDTANRIVLSLVVASFPLAIAFLLRSLGGQTWPALLTIPFAFSDAFGWGFLSYCASLPLLFASLGLWLRVLPAGPRRGRWLVGLIACLLALAVTHPAPVIYLAAGLPFLMLTTPIPGDAPGRGIGGWLRPRVVPLAILGWGALGAGIFVAGVALRSRTVGSAIARGDWLGLLAQNHFEFRSPAESLRALPGLLASLLTDGSDRLGPIAVAGVALAAIGVSLRHRRHGPRPAAPRYERARPLGLAVLALGLYLATPLHIYGYVGDLSPRFAPIVAALAVGLVPPLGGRSRRVFLYLSAAASLATAIPLTRGFLVFDRESAPLRELIAAVGDRPMIMGLIYEPGSRVVRHPVYLHAAATVARARGGIPNYTLAVWPLSPIRHRGSPPPSFHDEWRPERFDNATMGPAYDHFLGRGGRPEAVFGEQLGKDLYVAAQAGDWWLVRRGPRGLR